MQVNLSGKTALITGAGGAIGSAMARTLAQNGAAVAVCDVNLDAARTVANEISAAGGRAEAYKLDVTDAESAAAAAEDIFVWFGSIDILINNAGVNVGPADRKPIHEFSPEKWEWITSVDLDGVFRCSRAVLPYMIKSGGGSVINISSVVGQIPFRNQCAFAAAKAGVINLSRAMALELAGDAIRVNVICPGSILMEGTKALFYADKARADAMLSHIPLHRPGGTDDIANAALFLAGDESSYMTGSVMTIDGGWTCGFARDF
jgi:Dehydrogenases with different specificities (related to short-chain alcohol dehydrogenases)